MIRWWHYEKVEKTKSRVWIIQFPVLYYSISYTIFISSNWHFRLVIVSMKCECKFCACMWWNFSFKKLIFGLMNQSSFSFLMNSITFSLRSLQVKLQQLLPMYCFSIASKLAHCLSTGYHISLLSQLSFAAFLNLLNFLYIQHQLHIYQRVISSLAFCLL